MPAGRPRLGRRPEGRSTLSLAPFRLALLQTGGIMKMYNWLALREANRARRVRWHGPETPDTKWSLADWSNAAAGEMGELCNIVKKIRRLETGARVRLNELDRRALEQAAGDEIADVIIYLDILAAELGVTLPVVIREKFNRTSESFGFPEELRFVSDWEFSYRDSED